MTMTLPPEARVSWVCDPGHEWLEIIGDTETARSCATGYDYENSTAVYLEGDCSAGIYLRHYGFSPENTPALAERDYSPRRLRHLAAGELGRQYLRRWDHSGD